LSRRVSLSSPNPSTSDAEPTICTFLNSCEGGNPDFCRDAGCVPYKHFRWQGCPANDNGGWIARRGGNLPPARPDARPYFMRKPYVLAGFPPSRE
jgi:hypothetical protein